MVVLVSFKISQPNYLFGGERKYSSVTFNKNFQFTQIVDKPKQPKRTLHYTIFSHFNVNLLASF